MRVPTLLIGLGGLGSEIVRQTNQKLTDYDKQFVSVLCMDTNTNDLQRISEEGIPFIQTSGKGSVDKYVKDDPSTREWFPGNPFLLAKQLTDGAGQIRGISRLASEASQRQDKFAPVEAAINHIIRLNGNPLDQNIKVMIVCSICGGTGAGMAIQLPFYLREQLAVHAGIQNVLIRGLFVGPDIVENKQTDSYSKDAVYVNAYACLKELNAFYGAQCKPQEEILFDLPCYHKNIYDPDVEREQRKGNQIPYDFTFLMEKNNTRSHVLTSIENYIELCAEIIRVQLFTPMSPEMYSIEDNKIIAQTENLGMNRYCGSGLSRIIYPYDNIVKYVSLRWTNDFVGNFWLKIDKSFEDALKRSKRARAADPSIELIKIGEYFVEQFDYFTTNAGTVAAFRALRGESVRYEQDGAQRRETDRADWFCQNVEDFIDRTASSPEMKAMSESCIPSETALKTGNTTDEINRVIMQFDNYESAMSQMIKTQSISLPDYIIPSSKDDTSKEDYFLPNLIDLVHPITARYMLYKIQDRFTKMLEESQSSANAKYKYIRYIQTFDFDPNRDGVQGALTAYHELEPRNEFQRMIRIFNRNLNEFVDSFLQVSSQQKAQMDAYRRDRLAECVLMELLVRIKKLIELYESFFNTLPSIQKSMQNQIEELASAHEEERTFSTDYFVSAKKEYKEKLYNRFCGELNLDELDQNQEALEKLFHKLYAAFDSAMRTDLRNFTDKSTDKSNELFMKDMTEIFRSSVLKNTEKQVREKGASLLDIGVRAAMDQEIAWQSYKGEPEHVKPKDRKNMLELAQNRAIPFLSYEYHGAPQIAIYWGINPGLFPGRPDAEDEVDKNVLQDYFQIDRNGTEPDIIADEEFSRNEIICYQAVYGLKVENLTKYSPESIAYSKYQTRLQSIVENARQDQYAAYLKATIHPHLDKRWHQPAYIPALYLEQEKMEKVREAETFILSLLMKKAFLAENNANETRWHYSIGGIAVAREVRSGNNHIGTDVYSLYSSMKFNRAIVDEFMSFYDRVRESAFQDRGGDIMQHETVNALIGTDAGSMSDAFSLLLFLYESSGKQATLLEYLMSVLSDCLYGYCLGFSGNSDVAQKNYINISQAIYDAFMSKNPVIPTAIEGMFKGFREQQKKVQKENG